MGAGARMACCATLPHCSVPMRPQVFRTSNLELLYIIGGSGSGVNEQWLRSEPTILGRPRAVTVHHSNQGTRLFVAE